MFLIIFLLSSIHALTTNEKIALCELSKSITSLPWNCGNVSNICNSSSSLCQNNRITRLYFSNDMNGTLPTEISYLENLIQLSIYGNFWGRIPTEIGMLKNLYSIQITSTRLTGSIPNEINQLNKLQHLIITRSLISGTIPNSIKNLTQLQTLNLASNKLDGIIPNVKLNSLTNINLSYNQLSGSIPEILITQEIRSIDFSSNRLSGEIPSIISVLKKLETVKLSSNFLNGYIPQIGNIKLQILNLAYNQFSNISNISPYYYNTSANIYIDLTGNRYQESYIELIFSKSIHIDISPQDFNECDLEKYVCPENSYCFDGWFPPLSYTCKCLTGYNMIDGKCQDINECDNGEWYIYNSSNMGTPCKNQRNCINIIGSFNCCAEGYQRNSIGNECIDINECIESTNLCKSQGTCINTIGSYYCCEDGFKKNENDNGCIDINECLDPNLNKCMFADMCVNHIGNFSCCETNTFNPNTFLLDSQCTNCYGEFVRVIDSTKTNMIEILSDYNLIFDYMECFGSCNDGINLYTRSVLSSSCNDVSSKQKSCKYPCFNQTQMNSADSAISSLGTELQKDNFLSDVILKIFNVNLTMDVSKSTIIIFPIVSNEMMNLIETLSKSIVPNAPNLKFMLTNNNLTIESNDFETESLILPLSIVIGSLLVIVNGLIIYYYMKSKLWILPKDVAWSYELYEKSLNFTEWQYRGTSTTGYYYKNVDLESNEYKKILELIDLKEFDVVKVSMIYNKVLLENFIGNYKIQKERIKLYPEMFHKKGWDRQKIDHDKHNWVHNKFIKLCENYKWNDESTIIVPGLHGTDLPIAEKICETGFASLSSLDAGWYGKGIYFTTYTEYCIPYITSKRNPAIIVSWLLPGNTYPVCENNTDDTSLLGTPINSGYQSNYVVTNKKGKSISEDLDELLYNEIVIPQESQIVPAFIIEIGTNKLQSFALNWMK